MTINFFKCIQFVTICVICLTAGIKYDSVIGLALLCALTLLVDIKEAVEEGAKK